MSNMWPIGSTKVSYDGGPTQDINWLKARQLLAYILKLIYKFVDFYMTFPYHSLSPNPLCPSYPFLNFPTHSVSYSLPLHCLSLLSFLAEGAPPYSNFVQLPGISKYSKSNTIKTFETGIHKWGGTFSGCLLGFGLPHSVWFSPKSVHFKFYYFIFLYDWIKFHSA